MKTVAILLLALMPFAMAFGSSIGYNETNFVLLMKIKEGEVNYIAEQHTSLDRNMGKVMYTSDDPNSPAFDIIQNHTAGILYVYNNMTEECSAYHTTPSNLTEDYYTLLNNTNFVGFRGLDVELYNITTREGENTLVYGKWVDQDGDYLFTPHHLQQTVNNGYEQSSITVDFLDEIFLPSQSWGEDFYNPACEGVTPQYSAYPRSSNGILGSILPRFELVSK